MFNGFSFGGCGNVLACKIAQAFQHKVGASSYI